MDGGGGGLDCTSDSGKGSADTCYGGSQFGGIIKGALLYVVCKRIELL